MTLDELKTHCLSCTECELCKTRTQVVFGVGNPAADILLIGEGPGENEDLQGQPFVGRSRRPACIGCGSNLRSFAHGW